MKIITRILLGLGGLLALVIVVLAGVIAWDVNQGVSAAAHANVTYTNAQGITVQGYLAQPEGEGPFPAAIMLHEWWGLNEEIPHLADALAAQGYVVLAPDLYRNRVMTTVPGALFMRLTTPSEPIWADADAALDYLRGLPNVDPAAIVSLGFCFGGEQSLQLGLRRAEDLAGVVVFYGSVVTDPAQLAVLADTPVLGIFGQVDAQIPLERVRAFEQALTRAGVPQTVTVYDGMGHAFVTPQNYVGEDAPGQAWRQMVAFLDGVTGR